MRLSILTPIGFHFGEGLFKVLDRDLVAGPLVRAATTLMLTLIDMSKTERKR
ncbi:MAG TPA: hypothetical protein VG015_00020 [Candidatus Dormibacteraeota bacterium]|jgi:hypothetical protein|nr:hypothetical protein [Candidatus Dormibacteraeota bacterium]